MELVTLGVEKLWDQLSHEYETIKGVEDQVTELKSNLNLLKSYLKDADAKKHTNELVKHCVEEIKEIVYDAEDIIDRCILKFRNKFGIMKRIRRFPCTILDRRELASDIRGISKRISKVIQDMERFGVQQMITDARLFAHPLQERQKEMRQQFAKSNESNLVGLEENVKKLVGYLAEEDGIQIISVTGMGGLGKTTLARQVFGHEDVRHEFKRLAWVCVSKEFTRISVWQMILQNLTSKERKDEIQKMNEVELQDELYQLLETSKSLIVLDDIWRKEDWDLIKSIFPPTKGWKVLLTSRNEWRGMRGDTKYTNLKPECLTFKDSWMLFETIVLRKDAPELKFDEEMEKLGKQMVKHCGGLPLAIKVLGGLLAEKYTLHHWKRLTENIGSRLMGGNDDSCNYVLSLSYEELPSYLKHCFLYLAHFPEDYKIDVWNLSYYWAAEGIFNPRDGESISDIGESYIEELVKRNMVIVDKVQATARYEFCHMHDMMREVCLLKAKEENFLQFISSHPPTTNNQSSITSRRCVSHNATELHVERGVNNPKLRSLVVLQVDKYSTYNCKLSSSSYTKLVLLRVIDFSKTIFPKKRLASGIGKLIHLRYLSLEEATVSHLPSRENLVLLREVALYKSFIGRRMVCSGSGFPKLLMLIICGLDELEEWIVEEGSMPLLESLSLWGCPKLKEFPDGLRFITSIKELITDMKWKERLSEGGQEYYKVKHIPILQLLN